tara:strand:+ start:107 stop:835 length:729 start_codon:yes stop_codon:yes gene_type:complete
MKSEKTENIYTQKNGEYFEKNPTWHVEDSPWKARQIYNIINRNSLSVKSIVEVGCGAGEILNQLYTLLPNDIKFTGYDISSDALNLAKERTKSRLKYKLKDFLKEDKKFDLALLIDVFEHVDNYLGFLRSCRTKSLYSIFHIPLDISAQATIRNLQISARNEVGHLHYFTKDTALATLEDCGYGIIDYFYTKGSLDLQRTLNAKLAAIPRKILFNINRDFTVRLFGGFSLLVLTKNKNYNIK